MRMNVIETAWHCVEWFYMALDWAQWQNLVITKMHFVYFVYMHLLYLFILFQLIWKPFGKRPVGRPKNRWIDGILRKCSR
jgi:hypothetical protein